MSETEARLHVLHRSVVLLVCCSRSSSSLFRRSQCFAVPFLPKCLALI